jgi:hypothetical protein
MRQMSGEPLPLEEPVNWVLADTGGSLGNPVAYQDGRPSRQAAQAAAALISQPQDTPQYKSLKHKHSPEDGASNCSQTAAWDATYAELESLGPRALALEPRGSATVRLHLAGTYHCCLKNLTTHLHFGLGNGQ